MSDHAGPEVERDDERERLLRATREDALVVATEGETDVGGRPGGPRRDDVPEDRGQAMPDMALVRASMDEPGCCCSEDITAKHLEDRQEGGRDALEGRIVQQEPGRDACESEEQQDADEPRTVRNGLPGHRGRGRSRMAPEVERDDDHDRVHEDVRYDAFLEDKGIPIRRGDHDSRSPRIRSSRTGPSPSSGSVATRRRSTCTVGCPSLRRPPGPRIHPAHGPGVADRAVRRKGLVRLITWLRKSSVSLVPMHVWLIATPVNKAFVLIIATFILEHKHTLFRRRPVKAFKVIKSPEAFQLLADETRRRIIYLLRAKEMTVSQISAELGLTPQAIYHHIRKMRDADLVEVAREERVDHFIETYYRATAEMFNLSHGEGMSPAYAAEKATEALQALAKIGLRVRTDPEVVARIVELEKRMEAVGEKPEWAEAIAGLEDVDFFVKQGITHLAKLLTMTDKEFTEYLNVEREYRKLLRSLLEEPAKVEALARKA